MRMIFYEKHATKPAENHGNSPKTKKQSHKMSACLRANIYAVMLKLTPCASGRSVP